MRQGLSLLLAVFLLSGLMGCIPHTDQPLTARVKKPALLADGESISEVRLMFGQSKEDDAKTRVFELAGNRISKEAERLLRKANRWNEQDGLVLHVEIEKVRLRKTLIVLVLWQIIEGDEISAKVWITRDGTVVATETLTTFSGAGGVYATSSARRRIEILSDQIARKMVSRL
jgi:uncharacterized membrane protein